MLGPMTHVHVTKVSMVLLTGVVAAGLVSAPMAQAYPPGNKPEVFVKKFRVKPGKPVRGEAVNIKPGCVVTFTIRGNGVKKKTKGKANKKGIARADFRRGPKAKGRYKLIARSAGGTGCRRFVTTTSFRVVKKTGGLGG